MKKIPSDFRKNNWSLLVLKGAEAESYLHRISSINVHQTPVGTPANGLILAPTGKILLYFSMYKISPELIAIMTPYSLGDAFKELDRLHFAEPFVVVQDPAQCREVLTKNGLRAEHIIEQMIKEATLSEKERIESLTPSYPNEINSSVLPMECGLDHLAHENKGCYPGQEVIEKIRSYGRSPRQLVKIRGSGALPQLPTTIQMCSANGQEQITDAGILTSVIATEDNNWVGLAIIKRARLDMLSQQPKVYKLRVGETDVISDIANK
jgi:folate-binding protein YgfZ